MAKKKPAAIVAEVDVVKLLARHERLSDDVMKTNADIGDVRKRLGDVERKLDELKMLPLAVLDLSFKERAARAAKSWWARLLGR